MCWVQYQKDGVLKNSSPGSYGEPSPSPPLPSGNRISPEVLFIIVILALLFFISGLLHLLLRFLVKNPSNSPQSNTNPEISDALQRQLQQLFNQPEYDTGLDRAFIDALPVFVYREIVGSKEPLDCAVCLSEFLETHKLRLLPICGHAFHINCIDTWLLSNSTCPLCRAALFNPGFSTMNPMFDYGELAEEDGDQKPIDLQEEIVVQKRTFPVRLGKFCKLNNVSGEGESSSSNYLDSRRCYSMGSYRYVVGDTNLRVALPLNCQRNGDNIKVVKSRDQEPCCSLDEADGEGKRLSIGTKTDSFSVSKIWLWSKKGKFASSSNNSLLENPPAIDVDLPWMKRRVSQ
ncbi:PREDICTED: RING-H2 finger protein ATL46-like [Ipomoea nil]|uniref:RING-H2 finger protein ATL46-like n=1 Tax=Ipomoea nil TaxID=35883 RepID=UPI000901F977|nr:PREDICTED: RING-H2 finger protein ATL46-like [Ipomoea nil]